MTEQEGLFETLLSTSEAAEIAGVKRDTIGRWVKKGFIPSTRIGYYHYIKEADLREYMKPENRRVKGDYRDRTQSRRRKPVEEAADD